MSPRMYGSLWMAFAVIAAILFIGGVFSMLTAVVFGFIAFGLVFMGMMCVLPGVVSHPPVKRAEKPAVAEASAKAHHAAGLTRYRSV